VTAAERARLRGGDGAAAAPPGGVGMRVLLVVTVALGGGAGMLSGVLRRHNAQHDAARRAASVRAAEPADPGGGIDSGRRWIHACRLETVSFRARAEGWVTDSCGRVFRSTDGGSTFARLAPGPTSLALAPDDSVGSLNGEVARIEWLSEQRGVALGHDGDHPVVSLTKDGGATWRRVPARALEDLSVYASAHAGEHVWACGSAGKIFRSRDGGAHFASTAETPFGNDDRCEALAFIDERTGWAGGSFGALHVTRDGGDHWQKVPAPVKPAPTGYVTLSGRRDLSPSVGGIVARSDAEVWVRLRAHDTGDDTGTFVTTDGGVRWKKRKPPATIDALLDGGSVWGDAGGVAVSHDRLRFISGAELVRETPLARRESDAVETLRGSFPLEPGHLLGFTDHALVETFDDGRSWALLARAEDARIARVARVDNRTLVERDDGQLLLAGLDDSMTVQALTASKQPELDRYRLARVEAERSGTPRPPGPLGALAAAPAGSLELRLARRGCFEDVAASMRLAWDPAATTLTSLVGAKQAITRADRQRLLGAIAAALESADDGAKDCTTHLDAALAWRLGGGPEAQATFSESHCSQHPVGPVHRLVAALKLLPDSPASKLDR
jgi:photosystem II stability/assembly factor-like uncharacterized protein